MRSQLQLAEDAIIEKQDEEALIHVETALRLLEAAIVKSIKIEDRLKLYRFTIRGLGFERNKEFEELEFRGENLILKEKTLIDAMHQRKFREIWDRGNYRLGSTALRMVPMIIDKIPDGATINDYGSGTGRAEIELLKYRAYKINMIDIAENALEEEAKIIK